MTATGFADRLMPSGSRPGSGGGGSAARLAGFAVLYVFLDWLSYIHATNAFGVTPWNPQPAFAIAVLLFLGQRSLPVVVLSVVASELLVRGADAANLLSILLSSLALSFGYGATAQWLRGGRSPGFPLATRGDLYRLFAGVAGGMFFTGAIYIGTQVAIGTAGIADAPATLVKFWIGFVVGVVVTLPIILALADARLRAGMRQMASDRVAILQVATIAAMLWWVLRGDPEQHIKYFYVLFLPVVWVATRHGLAGASVAIGAIQAGVVVAIFDAGYPTPAVYDLQAVLIAIAITGLLLGATVDERTRLDEELRVSLKLAAAGRMAGAMAHELNQPLTALVAYAASARRAVAAPERMADVLDGLEREARRSGEVVRRMRDFFRIGAIELRPLRVDALLAELVEAQRPLALARGIEIAASLPESPAVLADRLQLEIVMRNLLANAFEALAGIDGPRRLEVSLQAQPDWVAVTVRDSGPGIAPQVFPRLFEPLASGSPAGMGMGLVICRSIVEAHGGRLWVEPGPGAAVHFTLPARDKSDE
jgi:two-component system sensor kinase FixL